MHDSYWRFHRRRFLDLVPTPGRLTLDLGCGEGRLARDLLQLGHRVVAIDSSPTMTGLVAAHPESVPAITGDAADLALREGCADLAVAFMSLQDVDDMERAVTEMSRVLSRDGRICIAIVHPVNSAGEFHGSGADAPFVIEGSYMEERRYADTVERDGVGMTFHSRHRTIEGFSRAMEAAGFAVDAIREVTEDDPEDRWSRLPMFLHLRAHVWTAAP